MRKWIIPLLAVAMFGLAVRHAVKAQQTQPAPLPPVQPARTPYGAAVAGAGLVEPQTENISLGAPTAGLVQEVFVKVGHAAKAGDPLFRLDDRQMKAEAKVREANLEAALAKLQRTMSMPRPEELPATEAKVREAEASLKNEADQLQRVRVLQQQRAVADEEAFRRQQMHAMAKEQWAKSKADYDLLKAGAWEPDKAIARAEVAQARALLEQTRIELERLLIRAPVDGEVLQVNVRPGEHVGMQPGQALIVLGNVHKLHLRADIDEHDIHRFRSDAPAEATVRGNPDKKFNLRFVRIEPYVVPKRSLTGVATERVDTRVMQVIYAVETSQDRLYVGQQMDVYVEARKQP